MEWRFAPTGTEISIALPGNKSGPLPEARQFFQRLARDFDSIIDRARPAVDAVFREWLLRPLALDLWRDVKIAGFSVEDPRATPVHWDVMFETLGPKWLGITVTFVDQEPHDAVVDT